jgi:hypothetical protein
MVVYPFRDPELRQYVLECIIFRYSQKESIDYISKKGYNITDRTFRNIKRDIVQSRYKRVEEIFDTGLIDQHLQAIDAVKLAQREMWINYKNCIDPYKRVEILTQIINSLPFLSQYYKTIQIVLMKSKKNSLLHTHSTPTDTN